MGLGQGGMEGTIVFIVVNKAMWTNKTWWRCKFWVCYMSGRCILASILICHRTQ